jgi:hypothetical protein
VAGVKNTTPFSEKIFYFIYQSTTLDHISHGTKDSFYKYSYSIATFVIMKDKKTPFQCGRAFKECGSD